MALLDIKPEGPQNWIQLICISCVLGSEVLTANKRCGRVLALSEKGCHNVLHFSPSVCLHSTFRAGLDTEWKKVIILPDSSS